MIFLQLLDFALIVIISITALLLITFQELEASSSLANDVLLITKEIPVAYNTVKEIVPKLWKEHKPKVIEDF